MRALYDWVTQNIRYDGAHTYRVDLDGRFHTYQQQSTYVLAQGKAVCEGYANLMVDLATAVGIPMVRIEGIGNNLEGKADQTNHAWNAVKLEGQWHLLDATWGAGHMGPQGFVQRSDPRFFLPNPEWLIRSHWPFDPMWQLLEQPLRFADFEAQRGGSGEMYHFQDTLAQWEALPYAERRLSQWYRQWRWDQKNVHAKFELAYFYSQLGFYKLAQYNELKRTAQQPGTSLPENSQVEAVLTLAQLCFERSIEHYEELAQVGDLEYGPAVVQNLAQLRQNIGYFDEERDFLRNYYATPRPLRHRLDLHPQKIEVDLRPQDLPRGF